MLTIYAIILIFLKCSSITADVFTSSSHLRTLLKAEGHLGSLLNNYIHNKEIKLQRLKEFYKKIEHLRTLSTTEKVQKFVGHPINAFAVTRRFRKEWKQAQHFISTNDGNDLLSMLTHYEEMFPTTADLTGAQDAFLRLQETFDLSSKEIVEGIAEDSSPLSKLGADDAYDIGKVAFYDNKHKVTTGWMSEALRLLDSGRYSDPNLKPSRFDILDHLAWSEHLTENTHQAYKHTLEMLNLDPNHERIKRNKEIFQDVINKMTNNTNTKNISKKKRIKYPRFYYTADEDNSKRYLIEHARSQELCRGLTDPVPKKYRNLLVCWFKNDHPQLVIRPAKVERIYPKPELLIFREAMSDSEIRRVKGLAHPVLQRATVHNPATGKLETANYRISKSAWLDESHDNDLIETMNKRIESYTGLNMETAEKLQVSNYGIGGHYETHFDFSRRSNPNERELLRENGNRIATMLFYMSSVERGGATVFTNIGQAVTPSKGDAIFWYNLHHDGSGDFDTRHAACPVLLGEKWVSNRWIHEVGQEFRRKCQLKPDHDYMY